MKVPRWCVAMAALAMLAGCTPPGAELPGGSLLPGTIAPTPSSDPIDPSTSPPVPAQLDMTEPGVASRIVKQVMSYAGNLPVVKVDISATTVTLAFLDTDKSVVAYSTSGRTVRRVDSDVEYFSQATFDPREYNISDIGALFDKAATMGAIGETKELQIVQYDPGRVLMTVTTRPESVTTFFRKDGSPIVPVDLDTGNGFEEAFADAIGPRTFAYALGYIPGLGVWVDFPGPTVGSITRRTRQAKLPAYSTLRSEAMQWPMFELDEVDIELISKIIAQIRTTRGLASTAPVTVVVDGHYGRSAPTMTFTFATGILVTDLKGTDITALVG